MKNYVLVFLLCLIYVVNCDVDPTYRFEQDNNYGMGHRLPDSYRRAAVHSKSNDYGVMNGRPEPLPTQAPGPIYPSPYRNIFQGKRRPGDKRVFSQDFEYDAARMGQIVTSNRIFDCILTHVAVETKNGIPILLRGGVNYRYFNVAIKAKPADKLQGKIKAYCMKPPHDLDEKDKIHVRY